MGFAILVLGTACSLPTIGMVSTSPVNFGKHYELSSSSVKKAHSRPILFGVTFGEEKTFGEITQDLQKDSGCDLLEKVTFSAQAITYLGFGQQIMAVGGQCFVQK